MSVQPRSVPVPPPGMTAVLAVLLLALHPDPGSARGARPITSLRQLPAGRRLPKLDEASAKAVPLIRVPVADVLASVKAGCRESGAEIRSKGKAAGLGLEWCRLETLEGKEVLASYYFLWFGKPLRLTSSLRYSLEAPGPIEELVFEDTATTRHESKTLRIGLKRKAAGWTLSRTTKAGFIEQGSDSTVKTVEQTLENSEEAFWVLLRSGKLKVGETYRYSWYDPQELGQTSVAVQVQAFQDAKDPVARRYRLAQLVLGKKDTATLLVDGLGRTLEKQDGTLQWVILPDDRTKENLARARPQLEPAAAGGGAAAAGSGPAREPTRKEVAELAGRLARWGVTGLDPTRLAATRTLSLAGSKVRDADLGQLAVLGQLEELDLSDTGIDGSGLPALAPLTRLRKLTLPPGVDPARAEAFRKLRPGCTVVAPSKGKTGAKDQTEAVLEWLQANLEQVIIAGVVIVVFFSSFVTALFKRRRAKAKAKAKAKAQPKSKPAPRPEPPKHLADAGPTVKAKALSERSRAAGDAPRSGAPAPAPTAVVPVAALPVAAAPVAAVAAAAPAQGPTLPLLLGELAQCAGQPAEAVASWFAGRWVGQWVWGEGTVSYATQVQGVDPELGVEGGVKVTLETDPVASGQYPPRVSLHLPAPPPPEQVAWGLRVSFQGVVLGYDPLNLQLRIGSGSLTA